MAQELQVKSYYDRVLRTGEYVSTNECCKLGMEFFLSNLLFKGDLSRIVYSKEDIAFRRRVELVGTGHVKSDTFDITGLDLPFCIYSATGSYEEDDRGSTQSASQIVMGQINPDTNIVLKGAAVKIKYSATAFFSRREDVNIASQLVYWEKTPTFPLYYIVNHTLKGYPLDIPVFITVDSFDSNTDYQEKTFLQQSKIFPVKIECTVRSYQTLIESLDDDTLKLPLRFSGLYGYNDGTEELVLTKDTLLIWGDYKFTPDKLDPCDIKPIRGHETNNEAYIFGPKDEQLDYFGQPDKDKIKRLKNNGDFIPDEIVIPIEDEEGNEEIQIIQADAIKGYLDDMPRDVVLDEFFQESSTDNTITIKWQIREACNKDFYSIVLYIPGIYNTEITDGNIDSFTFEGLHPGSDYDLVLITKSKYQNNVTYKLNLHTTGQKIVGKGTKLSDLLVGRLFSGRKN